MGKKNDDKVSVSVEMTIRVRYPDGVIGREGYVYSENINKQKFTEHPQKYVDKMLQKITTTD